MEKVFQIVIRGNNPKGIADLTEELYKIPLEKKEGLMKNNCDFIDIKELDKKLVYTNEDDNLFGMKVDVRIPIEECSVEFVSSFQCMFAYWDKLKKSEDNKYYTYQFAGSVLKHSISNLSHLQSFLSRMKSLKFDGKLEVKISVMPYNLYANHFEISEEEAIERLLDKHAHLLDWTEFTEFTKI